MAYVTNQFCWHGVITPDTAKAAAFYSEVLGWKAVQAPMGDAEVSMLAGSEGPLAHVSEPQMPGVPPHWDNYLRVDDVDASTEAASKGGSVIVPPTDIPPGRFSVVASPSGAAFCLFHEVDEARSKNHESTQEGSIHWVELHSKDVPADLAWLKATFGYTTSEMPMGSGTYTILESGGKQCGGVMASMHADAPSMWLTWIHVADVEAAGARVTNHGGKLLSDFMDMPGVGRMAIAQDDTGGVFGVIQPSRG